MGIFARMVNGWKLVLASFRIIQNNKILLIFPVLSTISVCMIMASLVGGLFAVGGPSAFKTQGNHALSYAVAFVFYFVNSAVIIFFNMALIHATFKILAGEKASLDDSISFCLLRLPLVLSWALVSASVDLILRAIEDKHEMITNIVVAIFGALWSLATFFVVPIMVYENVGIGQAIKRSSDLFKSTWGERVGASFSFRLLGFAFFVVAGIVLGFMLIPLSLIVFFISLILVGSTIACIFSAAETVFLAVAYQYASGIPVEGFNDEDLNNLFVPTA